MNTIDKTEARLDTHEQVCTLRYEGLCARLKRIEGIGVGACGTIIVMLIGIILRMN
jgi:hypothetical protein